jgi:glycerol-3-phosphate dehydrogenase (NAD+)
MDSNPQNSSDQLDKVCIIGSGNWGSAIATLVGRNCERLPFFESQVNMWVFEEMVELEDGSQKKLTEIINSRHENVKYLPGIPLPSNVVATPDLAEACRDATLLIFVLPHQFLPRLLPVIRESAHPTCRGVSLIKGLGRYFHSSHAFLKEAGTSCPNVLEYSLHDSPIHSSSSRLRLGTQTSNPYFQHNR